LLSPLYIKRTPTPYSHLISHHCKTLSSSFLFSIFLLFHLSILIILLSTSHSFDVCLIASILGLNGLLSHHLHRWMETHKLNFSFLNVCWHKSWKKSLSSPMVHFVNEIECAKLWDSWFEVFHLHNVVSFFKYEIENWWQTLSFKRILWYFFMVIHVNYY
jgi:hypothetical protein